MKKQRPKISRRSFLRTAALGAAAAPLLRLQAQDQPDIVPASWLDPYGGFKMGAQSYSLRNFDLDGCLERLQKMELHYVELFQKHAGLTTDKEKIAALKTKLAKSAVIPMAWGVEGFDADDAANRRKFEFAKLLGLKALSADPSPDSFASLDKLCDEFKIAIAIHNHGPGHRYAKSDQIAKAIEGHHKLIGMCNDVGHLLRAGDDPVKAVETFGDRIYGVHLKDFGDKGYGMVGTGKLDLVGLLRELKKIKYGNILALEYEEDSNDPVPGMTESLKRVREAVKKI